MKIRDVATVIEEFAPLQLQETYDNSGLNIGFPDAELTGVLICVVPGDAEVDLKAAARASGNKSVEMLHMKDLLPTTGYIRGGCSPIGMKKSFPTYIHSTCRLYDSIYVSAGVRGLQIRIAPDDLIRTTDASVVDLTV